MWRALSRRQSPWNIKLTMGLAVVQQPNNNKIKNNPIIIINIQVYQVIVNVDVYLGRTVWFWNQRWRRMGTWRIRKNQTWRTSCLSPMSSEKSNPQDSVCWNISKGHRAVKKAYMGRPSGRLTPTRLTPKYRWRSEVENALAQDRVRWRHLVSEWRHRCPNQLKLWPSILFYYSLSRHLQRMGEDRSVKRAYLPRTNHRGSVGRLRCR